MGWKTFVRNRLLESASEHRRNGDTGLTYHAKMAALSSFAGAGQVLPKWQEEFADILGVAKDEFTQYDVYVGTLLGNVINASAAAGIKEDGWFVGQAADYLHTQTGVPVDEASNAILLGLSIWGTTTNFYRMCHNIETRKPSPAVGPLAAMKNVPWGVYQAGKKIFENLPESTQENIRKFWEEGNLEARVAKSYHKSRVRELKAETTAHLKYTKEWTGKKLREIAEGTDTYIDLAYHAVEASFRKH